MKTIRTGLMALILTSGLVTAWVSGCNQQPKQRADAQISSDVQGRISSDSNLQGRQIAINVANGVVTLTGDVQSEAERTIAATDASSVEGVKTVVNNLRSQELAANNVAEPVSPARATSTPGASSSRRRVIPTKSAMPSNVQQQLGGEAPAPARATETKPAIVDVVVPAGTNFTIRTNDELSSEKAEVGDPFTASLDGPIYVSDRIAVPAHADVRGHVVDVKGASKFKGASLLALQVDSISYNGKSYKVASDRWTKQGTARGKNTAAKVGGGAALGAIIGGIAGGGKGAAIGAGVGAGAGAGAQAITHGEQIVLKPETLLSFTLEDSVKVTPSENATRTGQRISPPDNNQNQ
jgi:hypothetical protein